MEQPDIINLDSNNLELFFLHHLNKVYAAKSLLINELPVLMDNAHFSDLKNGVSIMVEDVKKQLSELGKVYDILGANVSSTHYNGLMSMVKDAFEEITLHSGNPQLRDMSILFYLQIIESIEMASFQILEMLAVKLRNEKVKQLINENYQISKADRTHFLLINIKYIA
jgi:ferritin-like metal-binding protein YciE